MFISLCVIVVCSGGRCCVRLMMVWCRVSIGVWLLVKKCISVFVLVYSGFVVWWCFVL